MATLTVTKLGTKARGAFGPKPGEFFPRAAFEALESADFVRSSPQKIIGGCGDERLDEAGNRLLLPPVFGGWFSAVLADALATRLWYRSGMTAEAHAVTMADAAHIVLPSALLCVHTDDHSLQTVACGCAAIAKAPAVLSLLLEDASLIDPNFRLDIVANIQELLANGYFQPDTSQLVAVLEQHGVKKEVLSGGHSGVAMLMNNETGKVYDRPAFYDWCSRQNLPIFSFFEYSRWAMRETARRLTPSDSAARAFFAAADAFNMAVPLAICNPETFLLTREQA